MQMDGIKHRLYLKDAKATFILSVNIVSGSDADVLAIYLGTVLIFYL